MVCNPPPPLASSRPPNTRELRQRVVVSLVGIPLILLVLYLGSPLTNYLIMAMFWGVLREWVQLNLDKITIKYQSIIKKLLTTFIFSQTLIFYYFETCLISLITCLGGIIILISYYLINYPKFSWPPLIFIDGVFRGGVFISGAVYLSFAMGLLLSFCDQPKLILWLLGLVWLTDSGAYFVGSRLRGPKLAPRISPGKTWSGALGGILCCLLIMFPLSLIFNTPIIFSNRPLLAALVIVGLSILGQIGDLLESAAKRYLKVKDSGKIIPGHGGLLDRFDSLFMVILGYKLLIYWFTACAGMTK